jgi:hypothetical protein
MRVRPTAIALRYLKGKRGIRAAPYNGAAPYANDAEAIDELRKLTGQDFGSDVAKWTAWLKKHPNSRPTH